MDAKYDWENFSNLHFAFAWWFIHTSRCQYKLNRLDKYVYEKFVCTETDKCQRNDIKTVKLGACQWENMVDCKFRICFDGKFAEMYEITNYITI